MFASWLILALSALAAVAVALYVLVHNRELERQMLLDGLTGTGSRRAFDRFISAQHSGDRLALVMIDCDHFRAIVESHGHGAGDAMLMRVAAVLRAVVGDACGDEGDVYRLGGDEFALVLRGADAAHASALVETVREAISDELEPHERFMTLSCGIACSPEHSEHPAELPSYGDRALFQAKRSGRNRTIIYDAALFDAESDGESRQVLQTIADVLAAAVDAKDAYTHAHSRNVADLSQYIARELGLDEELVADIALGGLLHDVGKIGVSDHVLKKPGKLTDEEWEEIRTHCDIGYAILSGLDGAERIREIVLCHHERPDGAGYPRGMSREDIPIGARIVGVADAFDSMTAERVYSTPRPPEEAMAEIVRLRGQQFDAQVVDALCRLMGFEQHDLPADLPAEPIVHEHERAA